MIDGLNFPANTILETPYGELPITNAQFIIPKWFQFWRFAMPNVLLSSPSCVFLYFSFQYSFPSHDCHILHCREFIDDMVERHHFFVECCKITYFLGLCLREYLIGETETWRIIKNRKGKEGNY